MLSKLLLLLIVFSVYSADMHYRETVRIDSTTWKIRFIVTDIDTLWELSGKIPISGGIDVKIDREFITDGDTVEGVFKFYGYNSWYSNNFFKFTLNGNTRKPRFQNMFFSKVASYAHFEYSSRYGAIFMWAVGIDREMFTDITEVTQREYASLTGGSSLSDKPVTSITWYEALKYCNQRSKKFGLDTVYTFEDDTTIVVREVYGYRLPTFSEWGVACMIGTRGKVPPVYNDGPWVQTIDIPDDYPKGMYVTYPDTCNYGVFENACIQGGFDCVAEWCFDGRDARYRDIIWGIDNNDTSRDFNVKYPRRGLPNTRISDVGFRCVIDAKE